jgi:heptosyltransferase-3
LFGQYESPSIASRTVMALGDMVSHILVPAQPLTGTPLEPLNTKKLLLLRLDGIGDNVCSWPAIRALREGLPNTHITLAAGPWAMQLYRECPWLDELVIWDSELFGLFRGKGLRWLREDMRLSGVLRDQRFDAGIDLRGDLLSILPLWLVAPPIRIGQASRGGKRLLTDPLFRQDGGESQRTYDVARYSLGLPAASVPRLTDWTRPLALERAIARLSASGWDSTVPSVALCPGALWLWRKWPRERFQELALRLKSEHGMQVVWFLEKREQAAEYALGDPYFCGELDEVAAALSLFRGAVSNDSGLMHLAVAAGCRTVQLFGPGDASRFAHHDDGVALLHDSSCTLYPCTQRGTCPSGTSVGWCLDKISVDHVVSECKRLLIDR